MEVNDQMRHRISAGNFGNSVNVDIVAPLSAIEHPLATSLNEAIDVTAYQSW